MAVMATDKNKDVFDVANWLDRANGRTAAPAVAAVVTGEAAPAATSAYVPRHRADVPVDSFA